MAKRLPLAKERARPREVRRPSPAARRPAGRSSYVLPFQRRQSLLFGIGLAVILTGYLTLSQGSITAAPLLLVVGYCLLLPLVFIWRGRSDRAKTGQAEESGKP
ncbi:MAG: hypothetical protein HY710_06375 [Candidatus Latescibacteria bacterium]|nr:hypothetical protein [Candidatus Latescibacterota bacterium]